MKVNQDLLAFSSFCPASSRRASCSLAGRLCMRPRLAPRSHISPSAQGHRFPGMWRPACCSPGLAPLWGSSRKRCGPRWKRSCADQKLVDAREYLTEICRHLSASINGTSPVAIKADADQLYIHSEQAVPIAIIVNELATNSLKYAFPEGRAGLIQITLQADDEVVLSVTDNGVGMHGERPEGVGSHIVSLLTQQLGGKITRENLASGCRVTLRMPKPPR